MGCRDVLKPPGFHEAVDQALSVLSVEPLAERVSADVLAGNLSLVVGFEPPKHLASVRVLVSEPDQPEGRPAVRPEVISPKPDRRLHESRLNPLRFGTAPD